MAYDYVQVYERLNSGEQNQGSEARA